MAAFSSSLRCTSQLIAIAVSGRIDGESGAVPIPFTSSFYFPDEAGEKFDVGQSSDDVVDSARLADLEWRVRRAVAQSNDRSKDLVDLRRLVATIDRSRGGGGDDGQRAVMTWGKTASSKDGRKNVTGLIAGMDHVTNANSLKPAICVSKDRQGGLWFCGGVVVRVKRNYHLVSLAIGIPTIRRDVQEYLHDTLQSLFTAMSSDEKQDAVVILMIAEVRTRPRV